MPQTPYCLKTKIIPRCGGEKGTCCRIPYGSFRQCIIFMTTINFTKLDIPVTDLNGESSLPMLYDNYVGERGVENSRTDDDDELFLDFGHVKTAFPYRAQSEYSRELKPTGLDSVVLENEFLKAVFIPSLGGRLWSLYDKTEQKELLFSNPVFRPAYLALRNAWFSGGVEWNFGWPGHHPLTCSPLFTAVLQTEDGTPVLRMYEYERVRGLVYQMDFFLPEKSKFLHARMRITNDTYRTVPVYWFSNIAVPELKGARTVTAADYAFTREGSMVVKINVPEYQSRDITYAVNHPISTDCFFKTKNDRTRFVCQLDEKGYGLVQASTARLKSRKLFVWGQGIGGAMWQEFLSGEGCSGRYCELQAGLSYTQYENLPMPPKTTWEWLEVYGSLSANGAKIHGDWQDAQNEAEQKLNASGITSAYLEQTLAATRKMAQTKADRLISSGSGWGALEKIRREKTNMIPLPSHLEFGETGKEQEQWLHLLRTSSLPSPQKPTDIPPSYMLQREWVDMMRDAVSGCDQFNWYTHMQLGCSLFSQDKIDEAEKEFIRSLELQQNEWAMYGLAEVYRMRGDIVKSAHTMIAASRLDPKNAALAKMTARTLFMAWQSELQFTYTSELDEDIRNLPRIRLYRAFAAIQIGELETAEAIIYADGGLQVPDLQECEISITELWYMLEEKKAERDGRKFDRNKVSPPKMFDFRMFTAAD